MERKTLLIVTACGLLLATCLVSSLDAAIPYSGAGGPFPGFGPAVGAPPIVGGKEFSHDFDYEVLFPGPPDTMLDSQQVVAWDGVGGVANVTDYTGTRPIYTPKDQIDALANRGDFAYFEVKSEIAHLVFSVDDMYTLYSFGAPFPAMVPAAGPVTLANGNLIGGAGELSVELALSGGANPPDTQMLWAAQMDINGMPLPDDVDGVEVWGPEPPSADADKYSLDMDSFSLGILPMGDGVSVWNASGSPYITHSMIVGAVTTLLGPDVDTDRINLDALMVQDIIEDSDRFDPSAAGAGGDEIIFSIRQIVDPGDPSGYYATGSELFVLDASGAVGFLAHGGHLWDKAYALGAFDVWFADPNNFGVIDINAIEAIGETSVPEPAAMAMLCFGLIWFGAVRHRFT